MAITSGLLITLLFLGSETLRSVPCMTPHSVSPCVALTQGFPVPFLSAIPDGNAAFPIIYRGAVAEDIAIWTVLSFAACYLIWLPSPRPARALTGQVAARV